MSQASIYLIFIKRNDMTSLFVFLAVICYIIFSLAQKKKRLKEENAIFLNRHPDAAKVYLTAKAVVIGDIVSIHTVEGQKPHEFIDKGRMGFYVVPGRTKVQISYTHHLPGSRVSTITKGEGQIVSYTTGIVDKILETEPGASYYLSFDCLANFFTFEAYQG